MKYLISHKLILTNNRELTAYLFSHKFAKFTLTDNSENKSYLVLLDTIYFLNVSPNLIC